VKKESSSEEVVEAAPKKKAAPKKATTAGFFGDLTSNNCFTLSIPCVISPHLAATHHSWKVFKVNWVDGSHID
jgi:hypothetical protein